MQRKDCSKSKENGRANDSIIEDISKMVLSLFEDEGEQKDLDSMENALTPILDKIRKKSTEQYFHSKDPIHHCCSICGENMQIKDKPIRIIVGLSRYEIKRRLFYCEQCDIYARPLDNDLNLSGHFSLEVRKAMLLLGQRIPFQEASDYLDKLLHVQVSDQSIISLVESVGKSVHNEDLQMVRHILDKDGYVKYEPKESVKTEGVAYLQMDAMMVQTREEGWKEIRNGILFSQRKKINVDKHHNWIQEKTCFSVFNRHKNALDMFKRRATAEAHRFGFENYEKPVIIADGAQWIWDYVNEYHPNAIQILDFFHASEYLGKALTTIEIGKKDKEKLFESLSAGKVTEVLIFLNQQRQTKEITDCIRYFKKNESRMDYGFYKDQGLEIGSGAIESTHRTLIQSRMKQAGMHWKKKNVQSIASVRARYESGRWDEMVDKHLKQAA